MNSQVENTNRYVDEFETVAERQRREQAKRNDLKSDQDRQQAAADLNARNARAGQLDGERRAQEWVIEAERKAANDAIDQRHRVAESRAKVAEQRRIVSEESDRKALEKEIADLERQICSSPFVVGNVAIDNVRRLTEARAMLGLWPRRLKLLQEDLARTEAVLKDQESFFETLKRTFSEATKKAKAVCDAVSAKN